MKRDLKILEVIWKNCIQMIFVPGILLLCTTLLAIIIANGPLGGQYNNIFNNVYFFEEFTIHTIVNDFFMAIFFLVVGCEIKKEVLYGNLSDVKRAALPIVSAIGGVIFPALIYMLFNINTEYLNGIGIPISTDIAFAVGAFMLFKNKIGSKLKIFLLSLAVVDDLLSIFMIAVIYSSNLKIRYILCGIILIATLYILNREYHKDRLLLYFLIGILLWVCLYLGGIHPTISGVILAIFIPSKIKEKNPCKNKTSLLDSLILKLSPICNLFILPLFAFVNTGIFLKLNGGIEGVESVVYGIVFGLVIGKPLGIMLFSFLSVKLNIAKKPEDVSWKSIFIVSIIAGIGFTMSILSTEIAFYDKPSVLNIAKMSILVASFFSYILSYFAVGILSSDKSDAKDKVIAR